MTQMDASGSRCPITWTAVGSLRGMQLMNCSLHGEWGYLPGLIYERCSNTGCPDCRKKGISPEIPAGDPF